MASGSNPTWEFGCIKGTKGLENTASSKVYFSTEKSKENQTKTCFKST